MANYLVPKETAARLDSAFSKCRNLSLILGRYATDEVVQDHKNVGPWLRSFISNFSPSNLDPLLKATFGRWQAMTAFVPDRFTGRALGRVLVGFGGKGALDFGLTLSFMTGLPTIPGSALKGMTRAYGLLTIAANMAEAREVKSPLVMPAQGNSDPMLEQLDTVLASSDRNAKALRSALGELSRHFNLTPDALVDALEQYADANLYRAAFGSQEAGGACVFYDAVVAPGPAQGHRPLYEVDVMTPHFKDYYDDVNGVRPTYQRPPHDGQNPVPITFLTVAARTRFAFAVGLRQPLRADPFAQVARNRTVEWLRSALHELGVGAKTAAGYGVFGDFNPLT